MLICMSNCNYDEEIESLINMLSVGSGQRDFKIVNRPGTGVTEVRNYIKQRRIRRESKGSQRVKTRLSRFRDVRVFAESGVYSITHCPSILYAESLVGSIDTRHGIEMISREITSLGERPEYTGDHEMSDATIKEMGWDLSRMVERPALVTSFKWTAADTLSLFRANVPGGVLPIKLVKIPFASFQYWRGDVVLRLQIAGSPLMQGIVAMTFLPLTIGQEVNSIAWDYSSLTINPTVYLYANTNTVAELRIPYNHIQSYIDTDFTQTDLLRNCLGTVYIYVLSPLATTGNVSEVTLSLFSILENSEFKVPRLSSSITTMLTAEAGFLAGALSSLGTIGSSIIAPVVEELGASAKSMMARVNNITPSDLVSRMASKALPSNFIGDAIDLAGTALERVTGLLGLDNPTIPTEDNRTIVKANGSMNYAVGPSYVEKLAVLPSAMSLVVPETFGTVTDEMDVTYLYKKFSYLTSISINKGQSAGTVLASIPLSPFPTLVVDPVTQKPVVNVGDIIQDKVWFPLLSYLGLPYRFWTGGLKYKILVAASSLHTCKLFFSFNYGVASVASPVSLIDVASQYGAAIEISQGSNEFEITVPYVSVLPYKDVCLGINSSVNSMGSLNIVIMNPLVAPDTVAPTISCVILLAGAEDFSYEYLCASNPCIPVWRDPTLLTGLSVANNDAKLPLHMSDDMTPYRLGIYGKVLIAEAGMMDAQTTAPLNVAPTVTDVAGDDEVQIAPPQRALVVDNHFGITSISLHNLGKKYQLCGSFPLAPMISGLPDGDQFLRWGFKSLSMWELISVPRMTLPNPSSTTMMPVGPTGLVSWMSGMYRQFKGSLRFKVVISFTGVGVQPGMVLPVVFDQAMVYWKPGPSSTIATAVYADIAGNTSMIPTTGSLGAIGSTATPPVFNLLDTVRLCVLNGNTSNVLEFEMPYSSPYLSTLSWDGSVNIDSPMRDLGRLFIVCRIPDNLTMQATVYVALGDEARFGTLYKIPLVYVPGVFQTVGSPTPTSYFPINNYGDGLFGIPAPPFDFQLVDSIPVAESGIDPFVAAWRSGDTSETSRMVTATASGVVDQISKDSPADAPAVASMSTGVMNPQSGLGRRRAPVSFRAYVTNRIRRFVTEAGSCTLDDLNTFIGTLSTSANRVNFDAQMREAFGRSTLPAFFKRIGIVQGRDQRMSMATKSYYGRSNRAQVRRKQGAPGNRTPNASSIVA